MANIWEKAVSILGGKLNSGLSYLITTVRKLIICIWICSIKRKNAFFVCHGHYFPRFFYDQFLWTMQNSGNIYWHQSVINPPNDHQERRVYILVYTLIVHTTLFLLRTSLQYEILFRIRNSDCTFKCFQTENYDVFKSFSCK